VHKGLETGSVEDALHLFDDIFPGDQEEADKLETNKAIVQAMLEGYFELYGRGWDGRLLPGEAVRAAHHKSGHRRDKAEALGLPGR